MSKHTPGPWTLLDKTGEGAWNVMGATHARVTYIDSSYADDGEIAANARLIAAAPELLEAIFNLRKAFYVDGNAKALRAAFESTHGLVERLKE